MVILTKKTDNVIVEIGENLDYMKNGYPRIIEKNVAYPDWSVNVYENIEVPEEVQLHKYCYTETEGFYENPDWVDPEEAIMDTPEYQAGYDQAVLDLLGV